MEISAFSHDFSDTIFWFLHPNSSDSIQSSDHYDDDEGHGSLKIEEDKSFWSAQEHLILSTLCRSTSIESRVRQSTKEALINSPCLCLRHEVFHRLSSSGLNCSLRRSKWSSSSDIPAGEHTYIEVEERKNGVRVRVIVELHFRAEFEMARAGEEYDRLVSFLPEVFVGKPERLKILVKIVCGAAKRCMKMNQIHMGPWRKHKYMISKWLSSSSAVSGVQEPTPDEEVEGLSGGRNRRSKASMLTFALLENLSRTNCHQAVAVV